MIVLTRFTTFEAPPAPQFFECNCCGANLPMEYLAYDSICNDCDDDIRADRDWDEEDE